jgi:hypothetical protein
MGFPIVSPAPFYLRHRTLILVLALLISILCITRIIAGLRSEEPWLNWLANLVLWLFVLLRALRQRLLLTEQGLEYTDSLTTVRVPWAQITRLVSRKALGIWPVEGLEGWTAAPKPRDLFIDLTQFSRSWRQERLGAILRQKVPQLFQASDLTRSAG